MKLEWYGHSCFRLCADEGTAVFDPYADDYVPGLPPIALEADAVFCSHEHNDHNARDKVTLSGRAPRFTVEKISCFHDELRGLKRGANTIHVIGAEGMRVAHLGDLGHRLSGRILKKLGKIDVLMIDKAAKYGGTSVTTTSPMSINPSYFVEKNDGQDYVDGGWEAVGGDNVPIDPVVQNYPAIGTIFVIYCSREPPRRIKVKDYDWLKVTEIIPSIDTAGLFDGTTNFSYNRIRLLIDTGYEDTVAVLKGRGLYPVSSYWFE